MAQNATPKIAKGGAPTTRDRGTVPTFGKPSAAPSAKSKAGSGTGSKANTTQDVVRRAPKGRAGRMV